MLNVYLSLSPLDPLSPPGRGIERTREVLCLASNLAIAELHDANRVDWPLIVADHVFGDPQVAASEHAPDGEAQLGRVVPAQGLHVMPAADPLTRLGIFYHDVIVLDLVFGVQVTPCGGLEWLLRISVHKIDNMVIHHLPIFLWQVVLNHGSNRKIF